MLDQVCIRCLPCEFEDESGWITQTIHVQALLAGTFRTRVKRGTLVSRIRSTI